MPQDGKRAGLMNISRASVTLKDVKQGRRVTDFYIVMELALASI
jgi:hypothetical protein